MALYIIARFNEFIMWNYNPIMESTSARSEWLKTCLYKYLNVFLFASTCLISGVAPQEVSTEQANSGLISIFTWNKFKHNFHAFEISIVWYRRYHYRIEST